MKVRVHYIINGYNDYIDIVEDTEEEIKSTALYNLKKRGIDLDKNNVWSEILDDGVL